MKSRRCAWILCVALGIAALTGCGASSTTETTKARKESGGDMVFDESATFGQIKKMDENTITIELGTQKKFEKGDSDTKPESEQPPEKENQDNGNKSNDKEQNGERPSMIDLTGEEQEIYVTDSTTITRQSMGKQREAEEITLNDISVGDIISVTLDDNNNAESIMVISGGNRGEENEDN